MGVNSLQERKEEFDAEVGKICEQAVALAKEEARKEAVKEAREIAPKVAAAEARNTASVFALAAIEGDNTPIHFGE